MTEERVPQENEFVEVTAGMKLQFIRSIFRDQSLTAAQKVIAAVIADNANSKIQNETTGEGFGQAWLGFNRLIKETGLSRSTIRAAIKKFDEAAERGESGWLTIVRRTDPNDSRIKLQNWYWPNWDRSQQESAEHYAKRRPEHQELAKGPSLGQRAPQISETQTIAAPRIFPAGSQNVESGANDNVEGVKAIGSWPNDAFDRFWSAYPHKKSKDKAQGAFFAVRRKGEVEFSDLMDGVRSYARKRDDRPWCNPVTWLSQGRWEDEPFELAG